MNITISTEVQKEYEAQAQAYFTAMREAVYSASESFETPISNSVMVALVAMQAERLACVPDGRIRKQMKRDLAFRFFAHACRVEEDSHD
ncbi:hypothetical protein [uncultured Cohaesibacter sp.]|uniref:hypothetical protein n=1 Tax=uncultured Cohaesibacter sp. TaxID=1002546 RepID=UPI0029318280|nr:hypothetical protein [uncultured Cohaesibacter sp.]